MSSSDRTPLQALAALPRLAGRQVNAVLGRLGYRVARTRSTIDPTSIDAGLQRAADRGIAVGTVLDVGASDGRWSDKARAFYPDAHYLLVEANSVHRPGLEAFKQRVPRSDYVLAAAANKTGQVYFEGSDPFGGVALAAAQPGATLVAATTLDHEVESRRLPGPYLVKLDTHGFELPILEGARKTLQQASLLVIEVYNFTLFPGALRFHEMCADLEKVGFRPIDLCEPLYRPKDGAFWQCDLFFARADRPEFQNDSYA